MQWYLKVLREYATFSGRARRTEFWMFTLVSTIISIVLGLVDGLAGLSSSNGLGVLGGIYSLAVLIPSLAVGVRRLHDTGRSGWWWFISLVPLVGIIVLIVFWASEGIHGPNEHGPNPKMVVPDKDARVA